MTEPATSHDAESGRTGDAVRPRPSEPVGPSNTEQRAFGDNPPPGRRRWPARFTDRLTAPMPNLRTVFRAMTSGAMRTDRAAARRVPVNRQGLPTEPGRAATTWVGHATFVVHIGGLNILTDPVWGDIPSVRRLTPPGLPWASLPTVDAVVISHNHYDHLDARTLKRLPRDTPVFVPGALASWFTRRGFVDVTELDWWESAELRGVRLDFVPAQHWSRRGVFDTCRTLWGGWVFTTDEARVYFAGDTGYGEFFGEVGQRYPGIDVALLPVGAYSPRYFLQGFHMDPDEAVRACGDVGAARMAPMHWGTFMLSGEPLLEPLERTRVAWAAAGREPGDLWDMAIGEHRVL